MGYHTNLHLGTMSVHEHTYDLFPVVVKKTPSGLCRLEKLHLLPTAPPFDRFGLWSANVQLLAGVWVWSRLSNARVRHTYQVPIIWRTIQQH